MWVVPAKQACWNSERYIVEQSSKPFSVAPLLQYESKFKEARLLGPVIGTTLADAAQSTEVKAP